MFFTLISNTLFRKITTSKEYLYIFIIGAICYSIVHWYLHSKQQEGIAEKIRQYLYYVMICDVIATVAIKKFYPVKESKKVEHHEETNKDELTKEQQQEIIQRMMIVRKQQELLQKEKEKEKEKNNENIAEKVCDKVVEKISEKTSEKTTEKDEETKEPELPVYKE